MLQPFDLFMQVFDYIVDSQQVSYKKEKKIPGEGDLVTGGDLYAVSFCYEAVFIKLP